MANSTTYTITVVGGTGGVKDLAGNALAANVFSSFTTIAAASAVSQPVVGQHHAGTVDSGDGASIELGVKFTANTSGYITGVEFYKAAANTGVHTGSLWSLDRQLLATGHVHQRDGQRLADAGLRDACGDHGRHDLCGQLPHDHGPLLG